MDAIKDLNCTSEVQATLLKRFLTFSLVELKNHRFIVPPVNYSSESRLVKFVHAVITQYADGLRLSCLWGLHESSFSQMKWWNVQDFGF